MERNNVWKTYTNEQFEEVEQLSRRYRAYLDHGKTERECINQTIAIAKRHGYRELKEVVANNESLRPGDKVYAANMDKIIALYNIGTKPLVDGMNILGAHVDSPRLDIKQNPLFEKESLAYLDTHYYGGIKKYQWVTLPLAIHGVIVKKDGEVVEVVIGEKEDDPVFCITDLLIHLAGEQMDKKAAKVIEGEDLNILVGSRPLPEEEKNSVKAGILKLIADQYGVEEEDFISAELEVVPAGKAKDCGLDRSMILAYGQDDRVCSYTSLEAMLEKDKVDTTSCLLLVDKEEIGSVGATGMQSRFFENTVAEVMNCVGEYSELNLRRALANSKMLSSDVSASYDPAYESVYEKKNTAFFGRGIVFNKYNGAKGKSGSNDANPEYIAYLRNILDKHGVTYQTAELGRVDAGGGGTIAYILALYGMQVVDSGIPVMSMHAPWEVTSKADLYEAKRGYLAFLSE